MPHGRPSVRVHSAILVAISFLLSAALHVALLLWLSTIDLELVRMRLDPLAKRTKPFALQKIKRRIRPHARPRDGSGQGQGTQKGQGRGYEVKIDPKLIAPGELSEGAAVGSDSALIAHTKERNKRAWEPRQAIVAISSDMLGNDKVDSKRRLIADIARAEKAPDIVFPVPYSRLKRVPSTEAVGGSTRAPDNKDKVPLPLLPEAKGGTRVRVPTEEVAGLTGTIDENEASERGIESLDDVLQAKLSVYRPFLGRKDVFFKLEVARISDELLPVLPKDIVFVQDASASMAEQRLHFCRDGLKASMDLLSENDRFDIIAFSDQPVSCFGGWTSPGKSSFERGERFISNLRSAGSTDILGSLQALKDLKVDEGRPCIAFVVTDGLATTGTVESAAIIREFTRLNSNGVSVFTMGTMSDANMYLLDLLSYCNGGATHVVKGGRWSIPADITNRVQAVSRPVLSNLRVAFAGRDVDVYPEKVRHLYMDGPLVLYGKCPSDAKRVTFQAIGAAGDKRCDMIFDLPLDRDVEKADKQLRSNWAMQKLYHLMGEIARSGSRDRIDELKALAHDYKLKIPYADQLQPD